jgi:peptide-methionine (S)-S-oxide reductase
MVMNFFLSFLGLVFFTACSNTESKQSTQNTVLSNNNNLSVMDTSSIDTATFGAGCFWCVDAIFRELKGVVKVESGYSGVKIKNPTYREVCSGLTGHAEVCRIVFNPAQISFAELLSVFWQTHDPTTLNRQGADEGTQYRSVIFFHHPGQQKEAEDYKKKLDESGAFNEKIVTEISPAVAFYPAEDYHQDYYTQNGDQPYCKFVIEPKMDKFKKAFKDKLRSAH